MVRTGVSGPVVSDNLEDQHARCLLPGIEPKAEEGESIEAGAKEGVVEAGAVGSAAGVAVKVGGP